MLDRRLRATKDVVLDPLAHWIGSRLGPTWITAAGLAVGLVSFGLSMAQAYAWALAAFLTNRFLDGLDGAVARHRDQQSELGGYLDLMADFVVYATLPIGLALSRPMDAGLMTALAIMLAAFYVNAASWMLLIPATGPGAGERGRDPVRTSFPMRPGLIEGTETIVLYVGFFLFPSHLEAWFWLTATLVAVTAAQRGWWAARDLPR